MDISKVFICHRLLEITFKIRHSYFTVWWRCTGIYMGLFSYSILFYFVYVQYTIAVILAMILMVVTTFLDGLTQFFGFMESNSILRFSSGLQVLGLNFGLSQVK
ncbi:DUF2085 domain-containing protein [Methanobacterium sp. MBAC-LM]|uniref:DUF2085 domain-containing protein n=1 Tax=Methanobacterium sp. MBAC-LM TaxID=3412034 RepID=UPI003C7089FC